MINLDAHEISKNLWIGARPTDRDVRGHFDLVVLCAEEYQPRLPVQTLYVPVDDGVVTEDLVKATLGASREVVKALKKGKRVLVSCWAGVNRSALVTALALMQLGHTADGAIARIRAKRQPKIGMRPLSNAHFVRYLLTLDEQRRVR